MKNYDEWKTTNPTDNQLGPDLYILSEVAAREIAQQLEDNREKDVEIDRLKALIAELCDALDITTQLLLVSELPMGVVENKISENMLLQQRAREATHGT